jgi:hypothetical protein
MRRLTAIIFFICAIASPALAAEPNAGYYCGLSGLYPYVQVYTSTQDCLGGGAYSYQQAGLLPKSSPLPPHETICTWAETGQNIVFWHWQPRKDRLCYFADHEPGTKEN